MCSYLNFYYFHNNGITEFTDQSYIIKCKIFFGKVNHCFISFSNNTNEAMYIVLLYIVIQNSKSAKNYILV